MTIVGHRRRRLAVRAADRAARADSAEELAEVNRVLRTVTAADAALVHALDEAELFEQMCRLVVDVGGYPMAAIAIADPTHPTGLRTIARVQSRPGHEMVLTTEVHDAIDTRTRRVITADKLATTDYVAAVLPLYNADVTVGALVIAARAEGGFSDEELTLLDSLADNVGFGTGALRMREERQRYLQRVERSFDSLVGVVATTVEYRDPYTAGHQRSVGELAGAIAAELGVASEDIEGIETAAAIHDIGKVAIPAEILAKPAKLNAIEFELIKGHCAVGAEILKAIDFPWPVATMVLQHHERMDGSGYPSGLAGEDILLGARIIGVADTIDAMSTHRPYRPSLGLDAALGVILDGRGSRFDPDVVDACLKVLRREPFASKWPQALTG